MADNLTHGRRALLADSFQQRYYPAATVVGGGAVPDLIFLRPQRPVLSFVHHRGMTHSFPGGLVSSSAPRYGALHTGAWL